LVHRGEVNPLRLGQRLKLISLRFQIHDPASLSKETESADEISLIGSGANRQPLVAFQPL
jgi:hypothetical protein